MNIETYCSVHSHYLSCEFGLIINVISEISAVNLTLEQGLNNISSEHSKEKKNSRRLNKRCPLISSILCDSC